MNVTITEKENGNGVAFSEGRFRGASMLLRLLRRGYGLACRRQPRRTCARRHRLPIYPIGPCRPHSWTCLSIRPGQRLAAQ